METTRFNAAQIYLLRMFKYMKTPEELEEMKNVLFQYYAKKAREEMDKLWESGQLDEKRLEEINRTDLHAAFKKNVENRS